MLAFPSTSARSYDCASLREHGGMSGTSLTAGLEWKNFLIVIYPVDRDIGHWIPDNEYRSIELDRAINSMVCISKPQAQERARWSPHDRNSLFLSMAVLLWATKFERKKDASGRLLPLDLDGWVDVGLVA